MNAVCAARYSLKSNGQPVCVGDTVRIYGEMTGEVVDLMRETHPRGAWLACIRWGTTEIVSAWTVESVTVVSSPYLYFSTGTPGLPGGLSYVNPAAVLEVSADETAPPNRSVTGYGGKIPTRYRIKLQDGRTRRVYMMQYGNSGSPYLRIGGRTVHLGVDLEHLLREL